MKEFRGSESSRSQAKNLDLPGPLNIEISNYSVDGKPKKSGQFNQEMINKISYNLMTSGSENDIAAVSLG